MIDRVKAEYDRIRKFALGVLENIADDSIGDVDSRLEACGMLLSECRDREQFELQMLSMRQQEEFQLRMERQQQMQDDFPDQEKHGERCPQQQAKD